MPCLTIEQIEQLAHGSAEGAEIEGWRRHLSECDKCRRQYEEALANEDALRKLRRQPDSDTHRSEQATGPAIKIEGYEIVREVGRGAQAIVYEAIQKGTKQTVALKILLEAMVTHEARRWRFEREMELAARLKHANCIRG